MVGGGDDRRRRVTDLADDLRMGDVGLVGNISGDLDGAVNRSRVDVGRGTDDSESSTAISTCVIPVPYPNEWFGKPQRVPSGRACAV